MRLAPHGVARPASQLAAAVALVTLMALSVGCGAAARPQPETTTLTVFGAASLGPALEALGSAYEASAGIEIVISTGSSTTLRTQIEQGAQADVFLSANDHLYERFKPQNANAGLDGAAGVTQFVVGTGGKSLYSWGSIKPNSAFRNNSNYGVLKVTLHPASYDWAFVTIGDKVLDSGTASCH